MYSEYKEKDDNMKIEDLHYKMSVESIDDENWDLETWRKGHPMDYHKALFFLQKADNAKMVSAVFNTIYKITRLHVPDVLYKYYSLSENEELYKKKFRALSERKLHMSDVKDFNDPFDQN